MNKAGYHKQAIDMLGWIFGWYKDRRSNYRVPDGFQIHHIDRDYTNNSLDNLAILTVEEHWKVHEKDREIGCKIGGKKTGEKLSKPVICVETGVVYESVREAERQTGITNPSIVKVCKGKYKTAGGYHWRYVE